MWRRRNREAQPPPDTRSLSFDWMDSCMPWDCFRNFRRTSWLCGGRSSDSERSCCSIYRLCCRRSEAASPESSQVPPQGNSNGLGCICPLSRQITNTSNTDINTELDTDTPRQKHSQFCFGRMARTYEVERKRSQSFNGTYSKLIHSVIHDSPTASVDNTSHRCLNPIACPTDRDGNIDRIRFLSSDTRNILSNCSTTDDADDIVFFEGCCGYATFSTNCCTGHPYLSRCQSLSDSLISSKRDYEIVFFRGKCGYASFDSNCCRLLQTMHYNIRPTTPEVSENLQRNRLPSPDSPTRICPEDVPMSSTSEESKEAVEIPVFRSQYSSQSLPEILILSCEGKEEAVNSTTWSRLKRKGLKRPKTGVSTKKSTLTPNRQSFAGPKSIILGKMNRLKSDPTSRKEKRVSRKDSIKMKHIDDYLTSQAESISSEAIKSALNELKVRENCSSSRYILGTNTEHEWDERLVALDPRISFSETDVQNMAAEISYKAINAAIVECENSENSETSQSVQTIQGTNMFGNELVYVHLTVSPTFECDSTDFQQSNNAENDISVSTKSPDNDDRAIKKKDIISGESQITPSERQSGDFITNVESSSGDPSVLKSVAAGTKYGDKVKCENPDDVSDRCVNQECKRIKCESKDKIRCEFKHLHCDLITDIGTIDCVQPKPSDTRKKSPLEAIDQTESVQDTETQKQNLPSRLSSDKNDRTVSGDGAHEKDNGQQSKDASNRIGLIPQESGSFEVLPDPNFHFTSDNNKIVRRFTFENSSDSEISQCVPQDSDISRSQLAKGGKSTNTDSTDIPSYKLPKNSKCDSVDENKNLQKISNDNGMSYKENALDTHHKNEVDADTTVNKTEIVRDMLETKMLATVILKRSKRTDAKRKYSIEEYQDLSFVNSITPVSPNSDISENPRQENTVQKHESAKSQQPSIRITKQRKSSIAKNLNSLSKKQSREKGCTGETANTGNAIRQRNIQEYENLSFLKDLTPFSAELDTTENHVEQNLVSSAQEHETDKSQQSSSSSTKQTNLSTANDLDALSKSKPGPSNETFTTVTSKRSQEMIEDKTITDKSNGPQHPVISDRTSHYDPRVDIIVAESIVRAVSDLCCQMPAAQVQPNTQTGSDLTDFIRVVSDKAEDGQTGPNSTQFNSCFIDRDTSYSVQGMCYTEHECAYKHKENVSASKRNKQLATSQESYYDHEIVLGNLDNQVTTKGDDKSHDLNAELEINSIKNDDMSVDSLEMPFSPSMSSETKRAVMTCGETEVKSASVISGTMDNSPLCMKDSISIPNTSQANGKPVHIALVPGSSQRECVCPTQTSQINTKQEALFSVIPHEENISSGADDSSWVTVPWPGLATCKPADNHQGIDKYRETARYSGSRRHLAEGISQTPLENFVSSSGPFVSDSKEISDLSGCYSQKTQSGEESTNDRNNRDQPVTHSSRTANNVNTVLTDARYTESTSRKTSKVKGEENESILSGENKSKLSGFTERIKKSETDPDSLHDTTQSINCNGAPPLQEGSLDDFEKHQRRKSEHACSDESNNGEFTENVNDTEHESVDNVPRNVDILTIERIDFSQEAELFAQQLLFENEDQNLNCTDEQQYSQTFDVFMFTAERSSARSPSENALSLHYETGPLDKSLSFTDNAPYEPVSTQDRLILDDTVGASSSFDRRDTTSLGDQLSEDLLSRTVSQEPAILSPSRQTLQSSVSFEIAEGIVNGEDKGDNCDSSCVSDYIREYNDLCKSSLENERRILRSVLESVRGCYSPCSPPDQTLPALHGLPIDPRQDSTCIINYRSNQDVVEEKAAAKRRSRLFRAITEETDEQLRADDLEWVDNGIVLGDPRETPQILKKPCPRRSLQRQKRIEAIDSNGSKWAEPPSRKTKVIDKKKKARLTRQLSNLDYDTEGQDSAACVSKGSRTVGQKKLLTIPRSFQKPVERTQDTNLNRNKPKILKRQDSKRPGLISSSLKNIQSESTVVSESKCDGRNSSDIVVIQKRRNGHGGIVKEEKHLKTKRKVTDQEGSRKRYKTCIVSGICEVNENQQETSNVEERIVTDNPCKERTESLQITKFNSNKSDAKEEVNCSERLRSVVASSDDNSGQSKNNSVTKMSGKRSMGDSRKGGNRRTSVRSSNRYEDVNEDRGTPDRISQYSNTRDIQERNTQPSGSRYEEISDDQTNLDHKRFEEVMNDTDEDYVKAGSSQEVRLPSLSSEADDSVNVNVSNRSASTYRREIAVSDGEYLSMLADGQLSFIQDLESWREAYNLDADDIERDALKLLAGDFSNLYDDLPDVDKEEVTKEIANMDSMTNDDLMNSLRS